METLGIIILTLISVILIVLLVSYVIVIYNVRKIKNKIGDKAIDTAFNQINKQIDKLNRK